MNRKDIDLVVINPGDRVEIYQVLGSSGVSAAEPPIWAGLIANYILGKGYTVEIIDANAENLTPQQVAQRMEAINPLLAAVIVYGHNPSASTQVMPSAGRICSAIKNLLPEQKLFLAGGHAASLPERTLRDESVDFVCTGEGPVSTADLLECLKSNSDDYQKVRGIIYYDNDGNLATTRDAPNVTRLDEEMPGLPWHMLPMNLYISHDWHALGYSSRKPYASIYTTLGCPYKCEFCCIQSPFKSGEQVLGLPANVNSYRYWSPEFTVRQLKILVETYGVRHIKFADEMFDLNPRYCKSIYDGLIREGLGDRLNIWAYTRVDTVKDEKMIELALKAGIRWYCIGFESASERVRNDINKGYKQEQIFKVMERLKKIGANVIANFIVGLPEDDFETMQETLELAIKLNAEWFNIYSAMAYPGSALYKRAIKEGWRLPESWIGFSQHSEETLPLPTKYLTGGPVLAFWDYAHVKNFFRPEILSMLESKFGPAAVKQVRDTISKKLIRKYAEQIPGLEPEKGGENE